MFVNGSQALKQMGSQLKQAGSKVPALGNSPKVSTPSVRKHKKLLNNTVDAYERVQAIDTQAHAERTGHIGDLTTKLAQEGHHNISITTGHGNVTAQSMPRGYTGPSAGSQTDNTPGPDSFHQGGYYSAHSAHLELAAGSGAPARNHTANPALGASRPILALPASSAKVSDTQVGQRPGTSASSFVAGDNVVKSGSKLNPNNKKQPALPKDTTDEKGSIPVKQKKPNGKPQREGTTQSWALDRSNEAAWNEKLNRQEAAHLKRAAAKKKDDN